MFIAHCYRFLDHLRNIKNASEHTIRNYAIDLNCFKGYLEKELLHAWPKEKLPEKIHYDRPFDLYQGDASSIDIHAVDRKQIRGFITYMAFEEQNKRTMARRISSLRSFFKFLIKSALVTSNPMDDIDSPKIDEKIPLTLSYEQVKELIEKPATDTYLGFRDRTIMELFYSSGLRVSELVGLNRSDFNPENLLIRLRGKGRKERIVPITKNAATWIRNYLEHPQRYLQTDGHLAQCDPEAVFLNKWGTRLTTRSVDRNFDDYLKACDLSGKATPHTIRHTIATHWLENGMDLKTIQELLGHSTLATTKIYTQVSPILKKKVYDRTHPRALSAVESESR